MWEIMWEILFSKNCTENEAEWLVPDLFLCLKKQVNSSKVFMYFGRHWLGQTWWHFRLMIRRYGQFLFFIWRSGTKLPTTFPVLFLKKIFLVIYFISWPNFTVWLPSTLEILGNMCIVCLLVCDAITFEINLSFLIKLFFVTTKII